MIKISKHSLHRKGLIFAPFLEYLDLINGSPLLLSFEGDCVEDPCTEVSQLARRLGLAPSKLKFLPLAPPAKDGEQKVEEELRQALRTATIRGHWLVLTGANFNPKALLWCGPVIQGRRHHHPDFRLWLASRGSPTLGEHIFLPTMRCQPARVMMTVPPSKDTSHAFIPHGLLLYLRSLHRHLAATQASGCLGWQPSSTVPTGWIERRVARDARRAMPTLTSSDARPLVSPSLSRQLLAYLIDSVYYPGICEQNDFDGLKVDLAELAMGAAEVHAITEAAAEKAVAHLRPMQAAELEAVGKASTRLISLLSGRGTTNLELAQVGTKFSTKKVSSIAGPVKLLAIIDDCLRRHIRVTAGSGGLEDVLADVLANEIKNAAWRAEASLAIGAVSLAQAETDRILALSQRQPTMPLDFRLLQAPEVVLAALRAGVGLSAATAVGELEIVLQLADASTTVASTASAVSATTAAEETDRGIPCIGLDLCGPAKWVNNATGIVANGTRTSGSSDGRTTLGCLWMFAELRERLSLTTHPPVRLFHGRRFLTHVRVRAPKLDPLTWRMIRLSIAI